MNALIESVLWIVVPAAVFISAVWAELNGFLG